MSDYRDYRVELETGFTQLFGEAFRGLSLDCQRDWDWSSGILGGPPSQNIINERYILTIHVMYDVDHRWRLQSERSMPVYGLKQFAIGPHTPTKMEHQQQYKVVDSGSYFIVRAEYVTNDLSSFLDELNEEAKKAYDARFYEAIDKVIKTEEY